MVPLEELERQVAKLMDENHQNMCAKAKKNQRNNACTAERQKQVKEITGRLGGGFVHTKWCGELACELAMKEQAGVTSRCMPLAQSGTTGKCPVCGKECTTDIIWGVAY